MSKLKRTDLHELARLRIAEIVCCSTAKVSQARII